MYTILMGGGDAGGVRATFRKASYGIKAWLSVPVSPHTFLVLYIRLPVHQRGIHYFKSKGFLYTLFSQWWLENIMHIIAGSSHILSNICLMLFRYI